MKGKEGSKYLDCLEYFMAPKELWSWHFIMDDPCFWEFFLKLHNLTFYFVRAWNEKNERRRPIWIKIVLRNFDISISLDSMRWLFLQTTQMFFFNKMNKNVPLNKMSSHITSCASLNRYGNIMPRHPGCGPSIHIVWKMCKNIMYQTTFFSKRIFVQCLDEKL